MNGIVGEKLVRPAIPCRVCFWPATRERLPTPALMLDSVMTETSQYRPDINPWCISDRFVFAAKLQPVLSSVSIGTRYQVAVSFKQNHCVCGRTYQSHQYYPPDAHLQ